MPDQVRDDVPDDGPAIRFRLIQLDTLNSPPSDSSPLSLKTSPFLPRGQQLYKVPVLRLFGATQAGQRVVAHVHGAMPYFYVQFEAGILPDTVHSYIRRLGAALNYATAASLGKINKANPADRGRHQYVAYIALCKGIPFYGFHVGYRYFLKIYCVQPKFKKRMAELLRTGKVMSPSAYSQGDPAKGTRPGGFKVFEEHIPFHLQFMLDHNLYGCGWVELSNCAFRRPLPDNYVTYEGSQGPIYLASSVPESQMAHVDLAKSSYCPIELDCTVADIMNRHWVKERQLHQDFVEFLQQPIPEEEKLVQSVKELWEDERKRRQKRGQTGPEEVRETGPSSQRDYPRGEQPQWFMEPNFRTQIEELIRKKHRDLADQQDIEDPAEPEIAFKHFVKPESNLSKLIPTTFQAVDAIHVNKWIKDEQEDNPYGVWAIHGIGTGSPAKPDGKEIPKESADAAFNEEAELHLGIDIVAIQSQMESYNDDGPDDENDVVPNPALDAIFEEGEFDELNWDEIDNPDAIGQREHRGPDAAGSKHTTPTKSKNSSRSPAVSPSKRLQNLKKEFQSPRKLNPDQRLLPPGQISAESQGHDDGFDLQSALKRDRQEQDDGFYQPKAGKMMRFVERLDHTHTNPKSNFSHDLPSGQRSRPIENEQGSSRELHKLSSNRTNHQKSESDQPVEATLSPDLDSPITSQSINTDEKAKMRLDLAILTQTQHPTRSNRDTRWYRYRTPCPSTEKLLGSLSDFDLPMKIYKDPFYSDPNDVPNRKREYAGRQYTVLGSSLSFVKEFEHAIKSFGTAGLLSGKSVPNIPSWEFATPPPKLSDLRSTPISKSSKSSKDFLLVSQIEGPTQHNGGFKFTQVKSSATVQESQHMDVLAIEVYADSTNDRRPDPASDQIKVLFYCLKTERAGIELNRTGSGTRVGIIMVDEHQGNTPRTAEQLRLPKYALDQCCIEVVDTEVELLNSLIDKVRHWDPEVLTGFELESWSWGYVMRRGCELDFDLVYELGRVRFESHGRFAGKDDKWGYTHGSSIKITGRHVLSIWRIIRSELALTQYTFENVVYHVLRTRTPHYAFSTLANWWKDGTVEHRRRVLMYYIARVELDINLVEETEIISRNAEISRTLGVDFFSAISRGSQFKVESVVFRISKPENYVLPSPSREEVAKQNAAECIPLVMEPQSAFYKSPLLVLDFQSLYPSIMIAYNYCYSTCLGRVSSFKGVNKLGTSILDLPDGLLKLMKDDIIVSPNGLMFVKHHVRKSLLSKMLSEFLDTRVMIKQSMKFTKSDKALTKMLNARQLGLKFIANVTYGYTSASFSGRMPCVEIADAIVQTGRETLEKSMEVIHSVKEWGAKVVYGDTDSLFVYLPGKTKEEAFRIGNEMADAVTKRNPAPVKLKFEKVYLPCVLMAKKRYVGAKYENLSDTEPVFDAKGIEVVRRDGIPALQKIQETCLKKLFATQDLSDIKAYLYRQWQRLLLGKVSIQDFTFAKEVKLGTYSEKGPPPPGALIAARKMAIDPRSEPAYAERVPYVIVKGAPQSRLRDRAVSPELLLQNRLLALDAEYYINRVFIPALSRIFNIIGVDVAAWYQAMPRMIRVSKSGGLLDTTHKTNPSSKIPENRPAEAVDNRPIDRAQPSSKSNKLLVDEHFRSDRCLNCEKEGQKGILCESCGRDRTGVACSLMSKARLIERKRSQIEQVCRRCASIPPMETTIDCDSLDCSVLYERVKANWAVQDSRNLVAAVDHIELVCTSFSPPASFSAY
ncbi:DNA polymerase zeta, variant 2 [Puccinia graminis f. sp. tritici]|uniref:DNA polymerase n=1 Tax=Puccinia graminis f. sp. tritici TaxID=56615 RepID=A0A5B0LM45_PUCGR|nr:DNA polymerase zeta, variant 2 [Puccinia graminis f. sp. tritici]KAA1090790.1 DNA polymerase zeta, variant 2 [Puccinia graminis f. sp. tritici]